jgi:hypothetical protein
MHWPESTHVHDKMSRRCCRGSVVERDQRGCREACDRYEDARSAGCTYKADSRAARCAERMECFAVTMSVQGARPPSIVARCVASTAASTMTMSVGSAT